MPARDSGPGPALPPSNDGCPPRGQPVSVDVMPAAAHEPGETPAREAGAATPSAAPAAPLPSLAALRVGDPRFVRQLQRTAGNAAVGRLLRAPTTLPAPPSTPRFRERLEAWHRMRGSSMPTAAERRAAAEAAVNTLHEHEDVMRDGMSLVRELF